MIKFKKAIYSFLYGGMSSYKKACMHLILSGLSGLCSYHLMDVFIIDKHISFNIQLLFTSFFFFSYIYMGISFVFYIWQTKKILSDLLKKWLLKEQEQDNDRI